MRRNKLTRLMLLIVSMFVFTILGCLETDVIDQAANDKISNVEDLIKIQPATRIKFSMDRYLLNERNVRFNDPNKMCYLYVVMIDGTWLKVTIAGKLASTSKRLSAPSMEYRVGGQNNVIGPAPDDMGVFGDSVGAHVGMTTIGSLLECGGFISYIYSEVPLPFEGLNKKIVELKVEASKEERVKLMKKLEDLKRRAVK
jgi:hypothetical protein